MTDYHILPGCEGAVPAVDASGNYGETEKLQSENFCVAEDFHATSVPEYSTVDISVGDDALERLLSPEQSYSALVKNPFEGKWWAHCWVNPYGDFEEEEALIEIDGERLATRGGLVLVKGEEKVGKSTFVQFLESSLYLGKYGNVSTPKKDIIVVNCDTEQSIFHINSGAKRVMNTCKRENVEVAADHFFNFELRSEDMDARFGIIQEMMETIHPDVLVIDNLADLIDDYNNIKDSRRLISQLVQMAELYKCVIILVMHTIKGGSHALGTAGGDATKKAEAILTITKNGDNITCSVKTRNKLLAPFSITFDEEGLPVPCGYVAPAKKQKMTAEEKAAKKQNETRARIMDFVNLLELKPDTVYDYKVCAKKYDEKSKQTNMDGGQSYKTGERRIENGAELGIFEWVDGMVKKKFRLKTTEALSFSASSTPTAPF